MTKKLALLVISMILVVVEIVFTFILLHLKLKPLGSLTALAKQFASGDLTFKDLPIRSKDEIAILTQSFNRMATQLRDVLGTVNKASENLAASSEQRITNIVKSIQQDTTSAVNQMNEVTKNVVSSVSTIEHTGSSFTEILASSSDVSGKIQEMSAISAQLASNTQQVVDSFMSVNSLAKNTTEQTYTVSGLAEEQLATMEEIASSTEALTQLAFELNNQLTKFKI